MVKDYKRDGTSLHKRLLTHERQRKLAGQTFLTSKGTLKRSKKVQPPCLWNCRIKCYDKVTDEERQIMFNEYYALADMHCQWQYLARYLKRDLPKYNYIAQKHRERVESERNPVIRIRNRSNNIRYYLNVNNEMIRVCKTMFLATFDIKVATVDTVLRKTNEQGQLIQTDNRGRRKQNQKNKTRIIE